MRQLFRNPLLMVWSETFVRFGMALVVLPIALIKLQDVELSLWLLFNVMIALAKLADSGLSPTLLRATAYFHAGALQIPQSFFSEEKLEVHGEPNWERIHAVIATSRRLYVLICFVSLVLIGGLGGASVWNLMSMSGHNTRFWTAFAVLVAWACVQVQIVRWSGILQGLGKVVEVKRIDAVAGLFKIVAFPTVLLLDQGILGIAYAGLAIVILNLVFMRRAVLRSLPTSHSYSKRFDKALFERIWPATWRLGLINLGAYLVYHGSALVVAQLSDVKMIASYLLTLRIIFVLRQMAQTPMVAYMPNVIASLARHDFAAFRAWTLRIVAFAISLFCVTSCLLIGAGDWLLDILGSEIKLVSMGILLLLVLAYLLEMHHSVHATLYIATNHVPFLWPALLSGAAIVSFGLLVVGPYGLYGLVLVQIIVQALCNNWFPVYLSLRITHWSFLDYVVALLREPFRFLKRIRNKRYEIVF